MLFNNIKSKHYHKIKFKKITKKSKVLNYGLYGLRALESGFLRDTELKMLYFFLRKNMKKRGKIWFLLNPDYAYTRKPIQVRMGKGKGSYVGIYSKVIRGKIFLEIFSKNLNFMKNILKQLIFRLKIKVRIVKNTF